MSDNGPYRTPGACADQLLELSLEVVKLKQASDVLLIRTK